MAITAAHCSFKDLMMKRLIELMFDFAMAFQAEFRIAHFQQFDCSKTRLLRVGRANKNIRRSYVSPRLARMGYVAIGTTNVVSPMFSAPEVVVLLSARMAAQTGL